MRRGESGVNALLGIDKPCGMTSHDVVNHVRRALGERRVGHAGTLDPAASGVMVIGVGQGTRLMGLLAAERKRYVAEIIFGCETDTDDADGAPTVAAEVPERLASEDVARRVLAGFVGEQDQVPPAYSAISVGGQRSYALAREGKAPELAPRRVTVFSAELVGTSSVEGGLGWVVGFDVSKGTYVRSLARDIGRAAGSAAHLAALRRTRSGLVGLDACLPLGTVDAARDPSEVLAHALDPVAALGAPVRQLSAREAADAACGKAVSAGAVRDADGATRAPRGGERVAMVFGRRLVGVWVCGEGGLACEANFPAGITGVRA
ncbi:MAG: tRNA pseudouridine(55) synthase TruB [Coriobacteriaceae bacterium]|nr:tRNA pseudouridine(55) synthase TruB [Coriobacteriaceae bacterium]